MYPTCLALCLLMLVACGESKAPAPPSILGTWVSEPTLSQLGRIIQTWTFEADGRVEVAGDFVDMLELAEADPELAEADLELADMEAPFRVGSSGRYEALDGVLHLTFTSSTGLGGMKSETKPQLLETKSYRFEGDVLVLEDSSGEITRLSRK